MTRTSSIASSLWATDTVDDVAIARMEIKVDFLLLTFKILSTPVTTGKATITSKKNIAMWGAAAIYSGPQN